MKQLYTNALINSSSPYLLQHAHNPVNWQPWNENLIKKAKEKEKLLLISIGYAACHWCHVMEHESFEDEEVARVMNENFICIKVDREESPDVDHYYMTAVQLMSMHGGWPLNVIALPDGRPVWGGTYFPKETWVKNILAVARFWKEDPEKTIEYAQSLQQGIERVSLSGTAGDVVPVSGRLLKRAVENWKERFDFENGGSVGQPKFPMPVNLEFLLYYGKIKNDIQILDFVKLTLLKMARGGIYDQAGGGFARYSVDENWKIPHFEKMLYDNGQLISLYSQGYQYFKSEEIKTVVYETVRFVERELTDKSGAFYSSLDADSEGEEGKFYVWSQDELSQILENDYELFSRYYSVNSNGYWEKGNYILLRALSDEEFAVNNGLLPEKLATKIAEWKKLLLDVRKGRKRPGLDDKTLASWNALMIHGLADAYKAFGDLYFKNLALQNARFLTENMMAADGKLFHVWKKGKISVNGFMEDYALVIRAFISLFEITGEINWLNSSKHLLEYSFSNYYDENSGLFYFSENKMAKVLTNHFQNEDNVIPAANSVMANNIYNLYLLLGKPEYFTRVKKMLYNVTPQIPKYPQAYANWGKLMLKITEPYFEVVVCGNEAEKRILEIQKEYHPNVIWAWCDKQIQLPLFRGRFVSGKTLIYVCREGACRLPVETGREAMDLLSA
jgi:uncharacterized protein